MQTNADLRAALLFAEERQRRLRRTHLPMGDEHASRPVRRWIGRQLVRLGAWVAAEPTMRPARAR